MRNFIICVFCVVNVMAQNEIKEFSLDEAISFAIEHNRTSKNATLDIEVAKQQKWETTTIGLPQINAQIDYQN